MSDSSEINNTISSLGRNYYNYYQFEPRETDKNVRKWIERGKVDIRKLTEKLPPHMPANKIPERTMSNVSKCDINRFNTLSFDYYITRKAESYLVKLQCDVIQPEDSIIQGVVFVFGGYLNGDAPGHIGATKVDMLDQKTSVFVSRWQLQERANKKHLMFVVVENDEDVFTSEVRKSYYLESYTEGIPAAISRLYFDGNLNVDIFAIGLDSGAEGAIKFGNTYSSVIKGVISISANYDIMNAKTTSVEYKKHERELGKRIDFPADWQAEDLTYNSKDYSFPLLIVAEQNGYYASQYNDFEKEKGHLPNIIKGGTNVVAHSTHNWDSFWGKPELQNLIFSQIDKWSGTSSVTAANANKDSYLAALKSKMALHSDETGSPQYNEIQAVQALVSKVAFTDLVTPYLKYLASIGISLGEQTVKEASFINNQDKLLADHVIKDSKLAEIESLKKLTDAETDPKEKRKKQKILNTKVAELKKIDAEIKKGKALVEADHKVDLYDDFKKKGIGLEGLKSEVARNKAIKKYKEDANAKTKAAAIANGETNIGPETTASIKARSTNGNLIKNVAPPVKEKVDAIAAVANTSSVDVFEGRDPLSAQIDTTTQLLKGDFMDARRYEAIMPVFYGSEVPAYITLKDDIGAPGLFSNKELGLAADSTKTKQPPDLHDPFKNGARYNQMSIQSLQESHGEKYQIIDTLAQGQVIFSFGKKPEVWAISGILINDIYSNWLGKFREVWDEHLRIEQLVKKGKYARFVIPSLRIAFNGYPLELNMNHSSSSEMATSFSMTIFIREVKNFVAFPFDINSSIPTLADSVLYADGIETNI